MKRILIVRLSAIGDVIMASGIVPALRARYPDAHIAWLLEPMAAGLLSENSQVDEVILWQKSHWKYLWKQKQFLTLFKEVRNFRKALREHDFDLVIDLQGILKSAVLAWMTGAKARIGLGGKEGASYFHTHTIERDSNHPLICSEYRAMARYLELPDAAFEMSIPYFEESEASALQKVGSESGNYAVICPFTTRPQKHWFEPEWQEFVDLLKDRYEVPIVILGGPGDKDAAFRLQRGADVSLINLTGQTNLLEAAAVIANAKVLVGVDTGLTHLGIAKKIPTVALFGSTRPYLDTGRDNAEVIYLAKDCSPCRRKPTCGGTFDCMKDITPVQVLDVVERLLA
ncbi:MAG: glycosyltransferase family 9 protein [Agarilytica sp.]